MTELNEMSFKELERCLRLTRMSFDSLNGYDYDDYFEQLLSRYSDLTTFISAVEEKVALLPEDYVSESIKNMFAERKVK